MNKILFSVFAQIDKKLAFLEFLINRPEKIIHHCF